MEDFHTTIAQIGASLHQRMNNFESELKSAANPESTASLATEFATFKTFVIASLRSLKLQADILAKAVDNIEMRSRRKMLLIHGVPETTAGMKEDTASVICRTLTTKMKLDGFGVGDVSRCHRMGRSTTDKPRPILFKLCDMALRNKIWGSKCGLKGTGITISEFLTKPRHELFLAARERFGVSKCWTKEGSVFVISSDGTRHRMSSLKELEDVKLLVEKPKHPPAKDCTVVQAPKPRRAAANKK